jgi:UDP-N-acetylmuramoyl-tripeptide--D-alanyl-D-alanine ligase
LNNHIGVPLTLLSVTRDHEIAVIEMGANHRHEISLLCEIACPTHVLITNVGKAHLEGFGGFEGVKKGKGEMYSYAKNNQRVVFINNDNTHLREMLGKYDRIFSYGNSGENSVQGKMIPSGDYVSLQWKQNESSNTNHFETKLIGAYNYENILAAVAIGVYFGIDNLDINDAVSNYVPDNQRSQEIQFDQLSVIMDAYNANPTSMEAAILNFKNISGAGKIAFLGDMLELGEATEEEHMKIINLVQAGEFEKVVLVGPNFRKAGNNLTESKFLFFNDSSDVAEWLTMNPVLKGLILIKGSRGSKMERILEGLKTTLNGKNQLD